MRNSMFRVATLLGFLLARECPAGAQQTMQPPVATAPIVEGQVAQSAVGQAGQRQTRDQALLNITPIERIPSRLQNRIQSRLQTRIDRNNTSSATALTPFAIADEETRTAGRLRR